MSNSSAFPDSGGIKTFSRVSTFSPRLPEINPRSGVDDAVR